MFTAASTNVGIWHNVRAQPEAYEGTKAAALPTLVLECRLSGGNDTLMGPDGLNLTRRK